MPQQFENVVEIIIINLPNHTKYGTFDYSQEGNMDMVGKRTGRASVGSNMGGSDDSDSEYGFDGPQWSGGPRNQPF